MAYMNEEQMLDGSTLTLTPGQKAEVVLTGYGPFDSKAGNRIPKHLAVNAETKEEMEFVGFKFHDAIKPFNDDIVEGETVIEVECVDNGTEFSDYAIEMTDKKVKIEKKEKEEGEPAGEDF